MKVVDTKCFFLCWKCLKIVEGMGGCEIGSVKIATSLLLKKVCIQCVY